MIRVVRLISGEQIVTQVKEKEDKKDFLYLVEPLKMEIVPKLSKEFMVEEHMSLTEWIFHSQTKEHPIHKSKILTVANANDSLSEYYNNIKEHLKTRTWKMGTKQEMNEMSEEEEETMSDEDVMEYLRGHRTLH
tara:strand:+ start:81 stop:482 length:402 start_codon:yes stop_codon:yes gene_type:complete